MTLELENYGFERTKFSFDTFKSLHSEDGKWKTEKLAFSVQITDNGKIDGNKIITIMTVQPPRRRSDKFYIILERTDLTKEQYMEADEEIFRSLYENEDTEDLNN